MKQRGLTILSPIDEAQVAALDALLDFGRPEKVKLCILVDRRFNRQLPIQPDYVGKSIDTITSQRVKVLPDKHEVVVY